MPSPAELLEARVLRLERTNRFLFLAVAAALTVPVLVGSGRRGQEDTLVARRVQLVDAEGRVRIDMRHDEEETGVFVLDSAGDTRLGAAHFAHGGTGYALHGPAGRGAAVLYLKGDGTLTMYDDNGGVAARFPSEAR